jgi:hypothetical protein
MEFEQCKVILLRECELVQRAAALQNLIRTAVEKREWTDFESHFSALAGVESQIALLEQERETLFTQCGGGRAGELDASAKSRFYLFASTLAEERRNELTAIYRSLKLEALRLRLSNESLMAYLGEAKATMAGFFELAFPDRSGRIYTPRGTPVSHDMRSMVLNRRM